VEEIRRRLDLQIERRTQHADLHVDAVARALALEQRAQDAERQQRRAVLVDDRGADRGRRLIGAARDRGQAGHAFHEQILPRPVGVAAGLAVTGRRDVDQPRVDRFRRLPVETVARHDTGAEILDEHVGALDEPPRDGTAVRMLEVEGETALVAMREQEEDAHAVLEEIGPRPVALPQAAARRLDLDDVGAEVGEELHTRRSEQELCERDDGDARQDRERRPLVHYTSTRLRMCVAAATRLPRSVVTVTREKTLRSASLRSATSYVTVIVSPKNSGAGKRTRS